MPAPRLFDLAMKRCVKARQGITDIGMLPYSLVKPILIKIESATQLHEIEQNSPQIIGDDADLWQAFIIRDIPKHVRDEYDYTPDDPKDWWKMYQSLKRKTDRKAAEAEDILRNQMKGFVQAKQDMVTQKLDLLHRDPVKKSPWGGAQPRQKRNVKTGKELLTKWKSEIRSRPAPKIIINPRATHPSVVTKAPTAMLEDYTTAKRVGQPRPKQGEIDKLKAESSRGPAFKRRTEALNVEQRKLSKADVEDAATKDGASGPRKRPAPTSKRPVSNIFLPSNNKRRKIG